MRRTYRSKKDTASGVERRDLFQNLDGRSAPYDAFSIQNIKQTKRELSYNASSNVLGVASNRVRKKKFVKRIVKEPAVVCRESASPSAYLTPDKSIRVNKPLDPFDLLLMSSPARPVATLTKNNIESVTDHVNLFDQPVLKKEGKTYTKRKPKTNKKFNYSSSTGSSDSDKENSNDQPNITQNSSDIRTHKLLVEQEVNTTPKRIDDSINNIVNNLSLINKLKHKYNSNESINRSQRFNIHRLTKDIMSPLLQKSPLCSTPFKVKYRGESIFKFSPIAASADDSPKYTSITEDQDDCNISVVLIGKAKIDSLRVNVANADTPVINLVANDNVEHETINEIVCTDNIEEKSYEAKETSHVHIDTIPSVEISSFQTTETEPFLGFSQNAINEMVPENYKEVIRLSHLDESIPNNDVTQIEISENDPSLNNISEKSAMPDNDEIAEENVSICEENKNISKENEDNLSSTSDNDRNSLYDTCTSEQSFVEAEEIEEKEPMVLMQRMNESSFLKYYNKMKYKYGENDASDSSSNSENEDSNKPRKSLSNSSDLESENNSSDISSNSEDNNDRRISTETVSENESDENDVTFNPKLENSSDSNKSSKHASMISNASLKSQLEDSDSNKSVSESDTNENIEDNDIDDYDENYKESNSNNEEEKCMSFVTTRRRKEVTNNSIISMFNESYSSSSTNCDKTVLSNKRNKSDVLDNNDSLTDFNTSKDVGDEIIDSEHSNEDETIISFVTTRGSNVTDRKSSIRARKSSIKPRNSEISNEKSKQPRKSSIKPRNSEICNKKSDQPRESLGMELDTSNMSCLDAKPGIVLRPGKKWERSLSIYRRMTMMTDQFDKSILDESTDSKGRKYRQSVISTMEMQEYNGSLHNESLNSRRSTFVSKPIRSTIRIVKDPDCTILSLCNTTVFEDLKGFLTEECDDTIIELSKLSIADQTHEVTVLDNFHDTSKRIATAKDYVLRRCNQSDVILFDECYPDTALKNCHKIGEGVYGEVFLWKNRDGRARVLKIVPIAGNLKVNGESQKDYHEIISEIVIAMELSALRAPIAEIERHFDEGEDVEALDLHAIENATDIFNEVLAVRCVYGSYPSRLLDLWDLYDECKGSENDNPAILPIEQQYIVLELANAGQDLESYQFNNAEQAHALFLQVAYGLAVAEEAFQFEHRDLHWGNVLISPTEQKWATFVIRGRPYRVARCGVRGAVIDYSLSRVALGAGRAAELYNDLAADHDLFDAVGDYQFQVYRLMRDKLRNDWKNFEPYTNILWLHYTVDKMITALRYKRTNTKIHKHYIDKLKGIKSRILDYGSAAQFVLTDNEI